MSLHKFFFYLTIVLLPTQLGKHFFPDWTLVLGRRLDYLSPTFYLTDLTILLTLVSWFVSQKKYTVLHAIKKFLSNKFAVCIGFTIFVCLNIYFSVSPIIAFSKWMKVFELILFGWYIVQTKPNFFYTTLCLCLAVFYSSLIAISQFVIQSSIGGPFWFLGERTFDITTPGIARIQILPNFLSPYLPISLSKISELLRPYATFPHPNVLGGFLAVTLPLIILNSTTLFRKPNNLSQRVKKLSFVLKAKLWIQRTIGSLKLFRIMTIILGITALILTFSRSSWLAFLVLVILLLINKFKLIDHWKLNIGNSLLLVGVTLSIFLAIPYFKTLTSDYESVFVRNELNSSAISIWESSPIIGVGLGNFLVKLPQYYPHRDIFFLQPVHNIYLLLLSETGILGLFLFGCLIVCTAKNYELRLRNKWKNNQRFQSIIPYSLFLLLLLGFVDHYPLTLQQGQLLLTILISFSFL